MKFSIVERLAYVTSYNHKYRGEDDRTGMRRESSKTKEKKTCNMGKKKEFCKIVLVK